MSLSTSILPPPPPSPIERLLSPFGRFMRTESAGGVVLIVSTLAGMTSLWLMLDSPNWLDIQFITACVTLLVAAYWAGEAFRTMLYSMRLSNSDQSRGRVAEETALPIDVETRE